MKWLFRNYLGKWSLLWLTWFKNLFRSWVRPGWCYIELFSSWVKFIHFVSKISRDPSQTFNSCFIVEYWFLTLAAFRRPTRASLCYSTLLLFPSVFLKLSCWESSRGCWSVKYNDVFSFNKSSMSEFLFILSCLSHDSGKMTLRGLAAKSVLLVYRLQYLLSKFNTLFFLCIWVASL